MNPFQPKQNENSLETLLSKIHVTHPDRVAVIDLDAFKYAAAHVGEKKSIVVTHPEWDEPEEFKTRTDFWGRYRKPEKYGGWLESYNTGRELNDLRPYQKDEFTIEDIIEPEPLEHVLSTAKRSVVNALEAAGVNKYVGFIGKGASFREGIAKLQKYKGKRSGQRKPLYLQEITDYLEKLFDAEVIEGIECDDKCVMVASTDPKYFILGEDKDFYGCPVSFFNINKPQEGILDCRGFGRLWRESGGKVRGIGRSFMYYQVCSEDSVDCYKAHERSDVSWGSVKAFEVLSECENDKQAFEAMVGVFKKLYPKPITFECWTGKEVTMTWLDCFQELLDMARMLRYDGDIVMVEDVLDKMRVEYE